MSDSVSQTLDTQIPGEAMRLSELKDKLSEISQRAFDSTFTNLSDVRLVDAPANQGRYIHFDTEGRDEEIKEFKEDAKYLNNEVSELTKALDTAEKRLEEAENLLAEVKDDGGTLTRYRDQAKQSTELCAEWRRHAKACEDELSALRKRKGIQPGYFAKQREILELLRTLAQCAPGKHEELQRRAKEIRSAILEDKQSV